MFIQNSTNFTSKNTYPKRISKISKYNLPKDNKKWSDYSEKEKKSMAIGTAAIAAAALFPFIFLNGNDDPSYTNSRPVKNSEIIKEDSTIEIIYDDKTMGADEFLEEMNNEDKARAEYKKQYVQTSEIIKKVDFSGVKNGNLDRSFVEDLVRASVPTIKRNDPRAQEQIDMAVRRAQEIVDNISNTVK